MACLLCFRSCWPWNSCLYKVKRFLNRFYFCQAQRVCRDCPIPNCGAKYLVKLSNHLTVVPQLDYSQRKKWLQEAKLQPKEKVLIYRTRGVKHFHQKKDIRLFSSGMEMCSISILYKTWTNAWICCGVAVFKKKKTGTNQQGNQVPAEENHDCCLPHETLLQNELTMVVWCIL